MEDRIDAHIKANFDGKQDSIVKVDIFDYSGSYREAFPKIRDEITRRYRQANWNVSYTYGGRGKQYIRFVELTPKKQKSKR